MKVHSIPSLHVCIDLETLGNGPNAAIMNIGACRFNIDGDILSTYEAAVRADSEHLGQIDASTVCWWLQQSKEAQAKINPPYAVPLAEALIGLSRWLNANMAGTVWAHDPSFDLVILRSAYERFGDVVPVDKLYRKERSCRTIKMVGDMLGVTEDPREGVAHDALTDAKNQAKYVAKVLRAVEAVAPVNAPA